jgi:hypothetical protein
MDLDKTNAEVVLNIGNRQMAVGTGMSLVRAPRTNGDRAFLRLEVVGLVATAFRFR